MEDMDLTWEQKKEREQELFANKRVRMSESDGGQNPKRMKKMWSKEPISVTLLRSCKMQEHLPT